MLTVDAAKKIGLNACINKLGRDFVLAHKDTSTSAYGEADGTVFCFVGVDTHQAPYGRLILDNRSKFPYRASCHVNLETGMTQFVECIVPETSQHIGQFLR